MASSTSNGPSIAKQSPRIPTSQQFLVELLHAIYFAMFNEFASVAIQAVEDIHNRACYELYPDVILVTNAIKNSLQANPTGKMTRSESLLQSAYNQFVNFYLKVNRAMVRWEYP